MNPDMSVIGQFVADGTTMKDIARPVDAGLSDTEISLSSIVDPYFRGDFVIPISRGGRVEIEEGYLTTLGLPAGLQLKLGKTRVPFGKFNTLHNHVWLFVTRPLAPSMLLGPDGWKDEGAQLAWLAPLPTFHELSVSVLRGNQDVGFDDGANKRYAVLSHLRNFFEVSDDTAFEVGFSAAQGPAPAATPWPFVPVGQGFISQLGGPYPPCDLCQKQLAGADFLLRWKPLEANVRHSITLNAEAMWARQNEFEMVNPSEPSGWMPSGGWWVLLDGQPAQRWHFAARYDRVQIGFAREQGISAVVNFWPSEFSNFKLEFQHRISAAPFQEWNEVHLYTQIVLGAHGAHPY